MSGLSIHEKRQLAEQLAREQLSKSGQYRFGIPQSVLNAKANEFMRLSDKEIQKKFNEYFQSTGLNAKPKDLWDSMGLNLEQKKKAEAHMKGLQKQINTKYMQPQKAVSKKSTTTKNELPSDVKLETRQIIVNMLKQAYANKNEEFRTYLLNNRGNFAEGAMELHDLGSTIADGLTDLGVVVDRSDTRTEIHDKLLKKEAEIDVLADSIKDEKAFNELFKKYFHEDFDYQTAFDYICASSEFTTQDSANKIKKFDKKFESLAGKDLKSADDYMGNANRTGGLLDLGFQVGLMYASGGFSAIAKYAQMTAKGGVELAENVVTKVAGKKFAQSVAGKAVSQGVGIVSAQTTSAGANAVAFQTTKVAELAGESIATGEIDTEKAKNIVASAEGLFKFGYVGGAISGPLGMQVKGLTTKLLNSKPIINQILTKGITSRPTPLTSVLKDISEHSEAIGEVLKFGTEFSINAGYIAYDEGVSYTDAMKNLAQMDGVSKMVIAMLGGKNLEFLTPKKVQQIKTDLAGYKVNIAIYEGQKVYSVKDAKGKETVLATPEELFMFILDKEAQKVGIKAEGSNAKTEVSGSDDKALAKKRAELKAKLNGDQKEEVTTNNVDTTPRNTEHYIVNEDGSVTKVDNTSTEVGKEKTETKSNNEITTSAVLNNSKIVEKGHIFDKNTEKVIKINPDNIKIESSNTGISINDEFGNVLGSVMLKAECIVNGKTYLQFEGLQSNVDGLGIGTKLIQELEKKSIELGHEGRLIAEASPFISNGGNKPRTNLGFYYKLGFRATDSEIDKQITQCIQEGKDIPISLNCFTQIEYVPSKNASNNPLPQGAREQGEVRASNTEKNFDNMTARLKNGHVNYTLSTTEDRRNLVKIENSTKLFTVNRFDYYEFDKDGNLVKSQTQISEASAKEMFTAFKNAQTRNIRNRGGRLNAGVPVMDMAESVDAALTARNVRNKVGNTNLLKLTSKEEAECIHSIEADFGGDLKEIEELYGKDEIIGRLANAADAKRYAFSIKENALFTPYKLSLDEISRLNLAIQANDIEGINKILEMNNPELFKSLGSVVEHYNLLMDLSQNLKSFQNELDITPHQELTFDVNGSKKTIKTNENIPQKAVNIRDINIIELIKSNLLTKECIDILKKMSLDIPDRMKIAKHNSIYGKNKHETNFDEILKKIESSGYESLTTFEIHHLTDVFASLAEQNEVFKNRIKQPPIAKKSQSIYAYVSGIKQNIDNLLKGTNLEIREHCIMKMIDRDVYNPVDNTKVRVLSFAEMTNLIKERAITEIKKNKTGQTAYNFTIPELGGNGIEIMLKQSETAKNKYIIDTIIPK